MCEPSIDCRPFRRMIPHPPRIHRSHLRKAESHQRIFREVTGANSVICWSCRCYQAHNLLLADLQRPTQAMMWRPCPQQSSQSADPPNRTCPPIIAESRLSSLWLVKQIHRSIYRPEGTYRAGRRPKVAVSPRATSRLPAVLLQAQAICQNSP